MKFNKIIALLLVMAFLFTGCGIGAQPAEPPTQAPTEAPTDPPPTAAPTVVAVRYMNALPSDWEFPAEETEDVEFLRELTGGRLFELSADGSSVTPSMAASMPVDVTQAYAGSFGIPEDASRGYAFRIDLSEAPCWNDGTPITADDYIASLKHEAQLASFSFLANAREYLNGGSAPAAEFISLQEAGYGSVSAAREAGITEFYLDIGTFWGVDAQWVSLEDRTRFQDYAMPAGLDEMYVSAGYLYETYLADEADYSYLQTEFLGIAADSGTALTADDIGILKTGEYQLTLITEQPMTRDALAVKLAQLQLTTGLGRSCGPWQLANRDESSIELEPNPNWWGGESEISADLVRCLPNG